ncbi:MAG: iron-containing alcohol dehydrogenase [Bacteroidales bacterium]|nr:iron-containing alcohol dehydrogenase [Bacteroidales bacterium]
MIQNFDYQTPTRVIFGRGVVEEKLVEVMRPLGRRVLLAYGGGSIKRMGLYQKVVDLMKDFEITELSGIEPNPKYDPSVLEGVRLCKEHNIDVILSVGGGSVLDCCKAIAAGAKYDGDPWDLISYKVKAEAALPIVDIMTLAATGSEYDAGGVISRTETNDKIGYIDEHLFPVCSFLDPTYTFTVNAKHTAAGVADAFNHVLENFFCADHNMVSDGFCISILRTLVHYAPIAIAHPDDYEARAEIMFACMFGCNGILALGNSPSGWPMHAIEHALSAYYDITHGEGLAIITPHWMQHILSDRTEERFVALGTQLWGIDPHLLKEEIAQLAIDRTFQFFESIGLPMNLRKVGIDDSRLREMAKHIKADGMQQGEQYVPLTEDEIVEILTRAL